MYFKRNKRLTVKAGLLLGVLLLVCLAGLGCVRGLQPIGWSGGAVSGDTLFVGSKEGRLVALNVNDQSRQWSEPLRSTSTTGGFSCLPAGGSCGATGASGVAIYGTPVVAGELVYIGGYNGKVYAYNASTLQSRWVYPQEEALEPIVGGLAAGPDMVYFGTSDGKLYALGAVNGEKQWEFATADKIWATPAVADGTVYIGSFDNNLYALDSADGSLKWAFATEGAIAATPLVADGTVYIGSFDRNLYALDAADGSLKWQFMGENWFWAKPALYGGTLYVGCLDGRVYALEAGSGEKLAEFEMGSPVASSPVVSGSSVVFASQQGVVYALNAISQEMRQLADIDEEINGPLCESEGIVYIHTQDLTLRRINAATGAVLVSISLESKQ